MDAIKTAALPSSFSLSESVSCHLGILFTVGPTAVLNSSMNNIRRTDKINKIRTISEKSNSSAAGIIITAAANSMWKAISIIKFVSYALQAVVKCFPQ